MPRKGPKPSYQQIALHQINNTEPTDFIDTTTFSPESEALRVMSWELKQMLQGFEFSNKRLEQRYRDLDRDLSAFLDSAQKARDLREENDPGYAAEVQNTVRLAQAFERSMFAMAHSNNLDTQLSFFGSTTNQSAYNYWNENGEFEVAPQDMAIFNPQNVPPVRNQQQQRQVNQPDANQAGGRPQQQPPVQESVIQEGPVQESVIQEENVQNQQNQNQPSENRPLADSDLADISGYVQKAATYISQAGDEEFGEDLANVEAMLDGIDQEIVRISEFADSEEYSAALRELANAGQDFFTKTIEARKAVDQAGNSGVSRQAIDQAAKALSAFETKYQEHQAIYHDYNSIGGMADYHDTRLDVDLTEGRNVLEQAGYHPPKSFFPSNIPAEQVIASIAVSSNEAFGQTVNPLMSLAALDTRLLNEIDNLKDRTRINNCRALSRAGSELFYSITGLNNLIKEGKTQLAQDAMQKAVQNLKKFESVYETFQRYDPELLTSIEQELPEEAASGNYEVGKTFLDGMGYETRTFNGQTTYMLPPAKETSARGISYEQMVRSLSAGEWRGDSFYPTGNLDVLNTLTSKIDDEIGKTDAIRNSLERSSADNLRRAARRLLDSCLENSRFEDGAPQKEAAMRSAVEACRDFDETLRLFKAANPDIASKYTEDFDKFWLESEFAVTAPETTPEPEPEEEIVIEEQPVIQFNGSRFNTIRISADFMFDQKKRQMLADFENELNDQIDLYEKAGANPEFLEALGNLRIDVTNFKDAVGEARSVFNKDGADAETQKLDEASVSADDLEKSLFTFNQTYPGVLGEKGRRFAEKWQTEDYSLGQKKLSQIGRTRTAATHIERLKASMKDPLNSDDDLKNDLGKLLVTRELAGASSSQSRSLKQCRLSEAQIMSALKQKRKNPMFNQFMEAIPPKRAAAMVEKGTGASYQAAYDLFGGYVFSNENYRYPDPEKRENPFDLPKQEREENLAPEGEIKTAAKWIEDAQRKIKSARTNSEVSMQIARIFAARQLSEAERGKRSNLDNTRLAKNQIDQRAEDLLKSEPKIFDRFLSTMRDGGFAEFDDRNRYRSKELADALSGHGGKLEEKMRLFCHSIPNGKMMNHRLYQRYKPFYYDNYSDYLAKNQNERYNQPGRGDVRDDSLRLSHAQKMMTAFKMSREKSNTSFKRNDFEEEKKITGRDPLFKIMTMTPERCSILNAGKPDQIRETMTQVARDFTIPAAPGKNNHAQVRLVQRSVEDLYKKLTGGRKGEALDKFLSDRSPEFRKMVRAAERYIDKKYEVPDASDAMNVFSAVIDYQKGKETKRGSTAGKEAFNTSMELAKAVVQGTGAEKYLQEQVDYVNQKRGIAPNQQHRNKIIMNDIPSAIDKRKAIEAPASEDPQKENDKGPAVQKQ